VEIRDRLKAAFSFILVLSGLFILAFSTVIDVFQDPRRTELTGQVEESSNMFWIIVSSLLIAAGVFMGLTAVTHARGRARRAASMAGVSALFLLLMFHSRLFINYFAVAFDAGGQGEAMVTFSAGYFMHSGSFYTFPVIYVIFLVTTLLLTVVVVAAAYLLAPARISGALGRRAGWEATESKVVVLSLFVVLSLVVFLVSLVQFAVDADLASAQSEQGIDDGGSGFLADNLVGLHYLTAFLVGVLVLTISARVFLVNWGTPGPYSRRRVLESLVSVGRIERIMMGAVVAFDLLLLAAPPIVPSSYLSQDHVFRLTSRSLYFFFLLILVPYGLYWSGQRRLQRLLKDGEGPAQWRTPFSNASLRLVTIHLTGILLMTTLFVAITNTGNGDMLGFMLGYAAFTAVIFLANGVQFELDSGVPRPRLRGGHGAAPFFGFVVMGLVSALMLWGAGNTFQATYHAHTNTMTVENESVWGADILARLAAALAAGLVLVVALGILMDAARVRRPVLGHYLSTIISVSVAMLVVFSVGVWNRQVREGTMDAFTGFAFHQYGTLEAALVAFVLVGSLTAIYYSFGRVFLWTSQKWVLAAAATPQREDAWGAVRRVR
jgi:hypothetical protein